MKVADILNAKGTKVVTIGPDAALSTAVHRLRLEGIGALVVSDTGDRVLGLLSERDIVLALAEHGAEIAGIKVNQLMSHGVVICHPDDPIKDLMAIMTRHRVRHVPVIADGRLAGIVSLGDVVKNRLEETELEISVLRDAYIASH